MVLSTAKIVNADRSRRALKQAMDAAGLRPMHLAKAAKLSTPNVIYNFMNGRSESLSAETILRLQAVLPSISLQTFGGQIRPEVKKKAAAPAVTIKSVAQAGAMRRSFYLPEREQFEASALFESFSADDEPFGLVVRSPGYERVYRDGSILLCVPMAKYKRPLTTGTQVILQRIHGDSIEVTVRDLEVTDGDAFLWPRSNHAAHQQPVPMPWPTDGRNMWKRGDSRHSIAGVVVWGCTKVG